MFTKSYFFSLVMIMNIVQGGLTGVSDSYHFEPKKTKGKNSFGVSMKISRRKGQQKQKPVEIPQDAKISIDTEPVEVPILKDIKVPQIDLNNMDKLETIREDDDDQGQSDILQDTDFQFGDQPQKPDLTQVHFKEEDELEMSTDSEDLNSETYFFSPKIDEKNNHSSSIDPSSLFMFNNQEDKKVKQVITEIVVVEIMDCEECIKDECLKEEFKVNDL